MGSVNQDYPDYLNPFDSEEDVHVDNKGTNKAIDTPGANPFDEYPDHLDPFGDDDNQPRHYDESRTADDYDDSLNPFGDEETVAIPEKAATIEKSNEEGEHVENGSDDKEKSSQTQPAPIIVSVSQPEESLGPPPVPLPRTRSLLKKEQALRNKPAQQPADSDNLGSSAQTITERSSSTVSTSSPTNGASSFQRKKNKRNAPPLPVNFKRQVSGSIEAIEEELNMIGDRLAELELESNACQDELKRSYQVNGTEFAIARAKFVEIIRMKNSISRRQKELMYRKREITLDKNHSDIEYELRMIGNKQSSNHTPEDDSREKELLTKLVEIVEEKNDIVENLNRDTSCDIEDVEEALRRMNLSNASQPLQPDSKDEKNSFDVPKQKDSCYKSNNLVSGSKFSKIATLLPKSGTLKGTMKLKRKRLFKKSSQIP